MLEERQKMVKGKKHQPKKEIPVEQTEEKSGQKSINLNNKSLRSKPNRRVSQKSMNLKKKSL